MPAPIIDVTKNWLESVIIAHNFCPFAGTTFLQDSIHYVVISSTNTENSLHTIIDECVYLDNNNLTETSLLIFPDSLAGFDEFLDFIEIANNLLDEQGYTGIYQLAHFHPDYCFEGETGDDPANFTNRSPYPMLHLIREQSLEQALKNFPDPESVPERNIEYAREMGFDKMNNLLKKCFE